MDGKAIGLIPANYVKVLGKRRGTKESNYPVPNELDSFSSENQNTVPKSSPVTQFNQTSNPPSAAGITQSESAMNFEQQLQSGFGNDEPRVSDSLDSVFKNSAGDLNPLESVPDLRGEEQKPPGDT